MDEAKKNLGMMKEIHVAFSWTIDNAGNRCKQYNPLETNRRPRKPSNSNQYDDLNPALGQLLSNQGKKFGDQAQRSRRRTKRKRNTRN